MKKTRAAIREAFERLLETTDNNEITVIAIAREAQIGRKTFYAHYGSVDEVLSQIARERIAQMVKEIRVKDMPSSLEDWVRQFTRAALVSLHESPYLNTNVLRCLPRRHVLDMVRAPLMDACAAELAAFGFMQAPAFDLCLSVYLGGLCAAYEAWSSFDGEGDIETAAEVVSQAATYGIVGVLQDQARAGATA